MTVKKCRDGLSEVAKKEPGIGVTMKKFPGINIVKGLSRYFAPGSKHAQIYASLLKGNKTCYKISEDTGADKTSVNRYLRELMKYDMVDVERREKRGSQTVTFYRPMFWDLETRDSYEDGDLICDVSFKSTRKRLCSRCSIGIRAHEEGTMEFTDDEVVNESFKFRVLSKKRKGKSQVELVDFVARGIKSKKT